MCDICWQTPCHPRCPNAEEPVPVWVCASCGEGIFPEEQYLDSINGPICYECLDEMSVKEILDLLGEDLKTCHEIDPYNLDD